MGDYLLAVGLIFAVNLLPAFGPPTWSLLVFLTLSFELEPLILVPAGATAAASGRYLLAVGARSFRSRLRPERIRNLEAAREGLVASRGRLVAGLGLFAVSPLPSAQLFMAAGLLRAPLLPLTAVFFAGRLVSYSIYVGAATAAAASLTAVLGESFTSPLAIAIQLAMLALLVALVRVDWVRFLGRGPGIRSGPGVRNAGRYRARDRRALLSSGAMEGSATQTPPGARAEAAVAVSGHDITKRYGEGASAVDALRGVDVDFATGRFASIMGPSGSGKSTLLHILAGLERPTSGWVEIGGTRLDRLSDHDLTLLRRHEVGFVFQSYNLLPVLTAEENITLPIAIGGSEPDPDWLETLLDAVEISHRRTHRPSELSGGEQQRVAIARALVTRPSVVFADEPTGNLDSVAGREILALLRRAVDDLGQTIVMVTHDPGAAAGADRVLFLGDGRIRGDELGLGIDEILARLKLLR